MQKRTDDLIYALVADEKGVLLSGNGWGMNAPEFYTDLGVPSEFVDHLEVVHKSGVGKHAIIHSDGTVGDLLAVSHLAWLKYIAEVLKADTTFADRMMGRGSRARALSEAIKQELPE
jgi:hypothetical protein